MEKKIDLLYGETSCEVDAWQDVFPYILFRCTAYFVKCYDVHSKLHNLICNKLDGM